MSDSGGSDPDPVRDSLRVRGEASASAVVAALLELARSTAEDQLAEVLNSVANAVLVTSGYRVVVLNVFRQAWDDYAAALVVGGQESVETLLGSTTPRSVIDRLLATGDEILPGVFLLTDDTPVWSELDRVYTPVAPARDVPDAWQPEDALLVMLRDADDEPLGFVSVDEPRSGRRPKQTDLQLLRSVCTYAELALRAARRATRAEDDKRLLKRLSEMSPLLSRCESRDELHRLVTTVAGSDLGFERAALYATQGDGKLSLSQSYGGELEDPGVASLDQGALQELLVPSAERAGCWLVDAKQLHGAGGPQSRRSHRNGVGPMAWADHALLIPWFTDADGLAGVVVIEDPVDHLRPSEERCRAARLLVDLAASVMRSIEQQEHWVQQASYDSLTGLRNRRGLHQLITSSPSVALLLCDIDHFKQVNDQHGHELGDRVLARVGELLSQSTAGGGAAIRLGGEEFCVVLPNVAGADAAIAAERLRELTAATTRDIVPGGVTISIGVAASSAPVSDARVLLAAADRGLYDAKRSGRNRVVLTEH